MKKISILVGILLCAVVAKSQNGVENIIVEKYYVSEANDTMANSTDGVLPIGSTTYRIYVDMLPGYKLQAVFGVPTHELKISTTTLFFNNEDRGAITPDFTKSQAEGMTVMLDSWVTMGAACDNNYGVLKSEDDGVNTAVNDDGLLENDDLEMGIPLTDQDGFLAGAPPSFIEIGLTSELTMFDNQNDGTNGPVFSSFNGSWACLTGATGADSLENKVLVAQMTTDGQLCFELNVQVGTPTGGVEQYVAINADTTMGEILLPALSYCSELDTVTSVSDVAAIVPLFDVYPNPSAGPFVLTFANTKNANNHYAVYDAKGCLVTRKSFVGKSNLNKEKFDLSSYPDGLYMIVMTTDDVVSTRKVVKGKG